MTYQIADLDECTCDTQPDGFDPYCDVHGTITAGQIRAMLKAQGINVTIDAYQTGGGTATIGGGPVWHGIDADYGEPGEWHTLWIGPGSYDWHNPRRLDVRLL